MEDNGMIKDYSKIWRWILLLGSIILAAYIVSKYVV